MEVDDIPIVTYWYGNPVDLETCDRQILLDMIKYLNNRVESLNHLMKVDEEMQALFRKARERNSIPKWR